MSRSRLLRAPRQVLTGVMLCALAACVTAAPASAAFPGQGFLPHNRAWEMVSPADKNGGYAIPSSWIVRAAADGSAIKFSSLAAFGDALGTGITTDYMAMRSADPAPGHSGWSTHSLMPKQEATSFGTAVAGIDPRYLFEFAGDLGKGIFHARSPLTDDPFVGGVTNLYLRTDARRAGKGSYELITACARCEELTGEPLPPLPGPPLEGLAFKLRPTLVGASPDLEHVIFESRLPLTADTPSPPPELHEAALSLYEWDQGQVRLAGRIPGGSGIECDDDGGPACVAAPVSVAGQGSYDYGFATPHTVSNGADGHTHVFFTVPVDKEGDLDTTGDLYVRTDGVGTAQLNASERDEEPVDVFSPARYLDATPDGTRVYFLTAEALTDDAPVGPAPKLYAYDTTKPASAPDNLTFLSPDGQPSDGGGVLGMIGGSEDGTHVYFAAQRQLVDGEPPSQETVGIYLWRLGVLRYIAPLGAGDGTGPGGAMARQLIGSGLARQARVTPDGRRLLFGAVLGDGLLSRYGGVDHDHGGCDLGGQPVGCQELYLYDADVETLQCVSCNPDGSPSATVGPDRRVASGGTATSLTSQARLTGGSTPFLDEPRVFTDDGRLVFFSTAQKLVPGDTNGVVDAYVFDAALGEPRLLSGGEDSWPSFFLDASVDGADAFIATREGLTGWDLGEEYDIYDARVGGGFSEPPSAPPGCVGDGCQPAARSLADPTPSSAGFRGSGNPGKRKAKRACPTGKRRVRTRRGKSRCVPKKAKRRRDR